MARNLSTALSIAGFDPSSGAGVTADLAAFAAHGLYGVCAISTWTVQSTKGVAATRPSDPSFFRQTLEYLAADIEIAGIKIGALGSRDVAIETSAFLQQQHEMLSPKPSQHIVFDPVMQSSSGTMLFPREGLDLLHDRILPNVGWVTPNWTELAVLTGMAVTTLAEAESAASALGHQHPHLNVVVTAGDQATPVDVLRVPDGGIFHFAGEHIQSRSTHGTGCAFSSSLLANLVLGRTSQEAVLDAKLYVAEGIRRAPAIGSGNGPLDLYWPLRGA